MSRRGESLPRRRRGGPGRTALVAAVPWPRPVTTSRSGSGTSQHAQLGTLTGHKNWVFAAAFAPDGKTLATGSYD